MKECDILGGENILRPSYIFSGGQDPNPQDLRPWVVGKVASENAETKKNEKVLRETQTLRERWL